MERLTETTVEELQRALESLDGTKPAERLIAAIAYKHGVTQSDLADWFDVERKTIYNWLTRLEDRDFESAVRDRERPGRPRKLSTEKLSDLEEILHRPPTEAGYDRPAWTTELVQRFIQDRFGIDYSRPSCRRLMKEAGLRYLSPRNAIEAIDPEVRTAFEQELDNLGYVWVPN